MVNQWLSSALIWLYPAHCTCCDSPVKGGRTLCPACAAALPRIANPCHRCGLPLPADAGHLTLCGECLSGAPAFDLLIAATRYASPLTALISAYKFQRQLHYCRTFAGLLHITLRNRMQPLPQAILPVPLHPARLRQRGYNQALEIARLLGKELSLPVDGKSLIRHRATAAQSDLDAHARATNVRGAFAIAKPLHYEHVAILDDVVTTGNTVNEIAKLLKKNGVKRVEVWCVARAVTG